MKFTVISLMPEMIHAAFQSGLVGQAIKRGDVILETRNPREFGEGAHRSVDDRVFGGSDGMLMQAEPLAKCIDQILNQRTARPRLIHLSPRGQMLDDKRARQFGADGTDIVLIASRYAGIDERLIEEFDIEEVSIGDFVLSGGELPACVLIDAVSRHLPGVLGNSVSSQRDSFHDGLLEGPQYTRPRSWRNREVPETLLSGDQTLVADFQKLQSIEVTANRRFDLIRRVGIIDTIHEIDGILLRTKKVLREPGLSEVRQTAAEEIQVIGGRVRELIVKCSGEVK